MRKILSCALGNHCFASLLEAVHTSHTSPSQVLLCLSYAYKLIAWILFTLSDSQYLIPPEGGWSGTYTHSQTCTLSLSSTFCGRILTAALLLTERVNFSQLVLFSLRILPLIRVIIVHVATHYTRRRRLNLQHGGCVLIREGSARCVVRPLWSPRSLVFFVPWKPGDTVTARGRKELSVVETAGNTCFTHPSRGPWRIEGRQLVGLTGNAMVTVSTAALIATQAKRPATTGHMKSYVFG